MQGKDKEEQLLDQKLEEEQLLELEEEEDLDQLFAEQQLLKQKFEEACFKYVEATYGVTNAVCLIDKLYEDDKILFAFKITPKISETM